MCNIEPFKLTNPSKIGQFFNIKIVKCILKLHLTQHNIRIEATTPKFKYNIFKFQIKFQVKVFKYKSVWESYS
jgi:hypothetical protein